MGVNYYHTHRCSLWLYLHKAVTLRFHCSLSMTTSPTVFQSFHPSCTLSSSTVLLLLSRSSYCTTTFQSGLHPNEAMRSLDPTLLMTQHIANPNSRPSSYLISDSIDMRRFDDSVIAHSCRSSDP